MNKQYVYILSNQRHGNLFKVGGTDKEPILRANDLSKQTGVIGKFVVEWSMVVPDWRTAEKMIHYLSKDKLVEKEYFKLDLIADTPRMEEKLSDFFDIDEPECQYSVELIKRRRMLDDLRNRSVELLERLKARQEDL